MKLGSLRNLFLINLCWRHFKTFLGHVFSDFTSKVCSRPFFPACLLTSTSLQNCISGPVFLASRLLYCTFKTATVSCCWFGGYISPIWTSLVQILVWTLIEHTFRPQNNVVDTNNFTFCFCDCHRYLFPTQDTSLRHKFVLGLENTLPRCNMCSIFVSMHWLKSKVVVASLCVHEKNA